MTEAEAKTKWCPFARTRSEHEDGRGAAVNRGTDPARGDFIPGKALCIGSACMAWRMTGRKLGAAVPAGAKSQLDRKLEEFGWTSRVANVLMCNRGLKTVRDLVTLTKAEVGRFGNLGAVSIKEIEITLAEIGLRLGMGDNDFVPEIATGYCGLVGHP